MAAFNALVGIGALDQEIREAGTDLMALHSKRNRADYNWDNTSMERQDQALDLVENAREIVTVLQNCLEDESRADAVWSHFQTWVPAHGGHVGLSLV